VARRQNRDITRVTFLSHLEGCATVPVCFHDFDVIVVCLAAGDCGAGYSHTRVSHQQCSSVVTKERVYHITNPPFYTQMTDRSNFIYLVYQVQLISCCLVLANQYWNNASCHRISSCISIGSLFDVLHGFHSYLTGLIAAHMAVTVAVVAIWPYRIHERQTIATDVLMLWAVSCLSEHASALWKLLHGSRSCLEWKLLEAQGTLY